MICIIRLVGAFSFALIALHPALAEDVLEVNRSFIETYKNRLTISIPYIVDAAHKKPNPPDKDGDMHVAGRSPKIGLATVAEIQNAASAADAVQIVHNVEGKNQNVSLTGIWRIWPEHGGDSDHIQRSNAGPQYTGPGPTNPPHVFEVHPILQINDVDVRGTLRPIDGFKPKDAEDAFARYEGAAFQITATPKSKRVTMRMRMVGFNYVEFVMKLNKRFPRVEDGEFVSASIYTLDDELLTRDRRVGFAQGTAPDEKQKTMKVGECMRVLGIPRVDLALVSWRIQNAPKRPDVLRWGMPYEIVAVGIFDDQPHPCGDE